MRAVIIGNGKISSYARLSERIRHDDFVICADGGYIYADNAGIKINLIMGDFDSAPEPDTDTAKLVYPVRKDYTDSEICVKYALEHGYDEILMFGMTGSRMDHTLTNMLLLMQCENACIVDDNNEIYLLRGSFCAKNKKGKTLSIIPIGGDINGIATKGLDYPLRNETLYMGESRGNSNVICDDYCEITTRDGIGFVIINDGE